jgi:hypothetical protein
MKLQERKPSGREKDEAAVTLLAQLREKLHSGEISLARKAAYNLSWMQEDGLDILVEALLGGFSRDTKKAAAYGLRSMNGRMRKLAEAALTKGLASSNRITKRRRQVAQLMRGPRPAKAGLPEKIPAPAPPRRPGIPRPRPRAKPLLAEKWKKDLKDVNDLRLRHPRPLSQAVPFRSLRSLWSLPATRRSKPPAPASRTSSGQKTKRIPERLEMDKGCLAADNRR